MKKFDFPLWADTLFYALSAFVFLFVLLRYLRLSPLNALLIALAAALLVGIAYRLFMGRSRKKKFMTRREAENMQSVLIHLALARTDEVNALLFDSLKADGENALLSANELSLDGKPLFARFTLEPVRADEIAALLRSYGSNFSLAVNRLTEEALRLVENFRIRTLCGKEIYALLLRTNRVPEALLPAPMKKPNFKQRLRRSFSKERSKPFFVGGIMCLIMSLYVFFPIYYVVAGSILLGISITVRLFGFSPR